MGLVPAITNRPDEPRHEMRGIGCPSKAHQAEDVKDNHEQDAEQDRNQHDRCRKSFPRAGRYTPLSAGPCPAPPPAQSPATEPIASDAHEAQSDVSDGAR
jgi:hypothetical protein